MELIQWWRNYFKDAPSKPTKAVNGGPLLDNVLSGKDVNIEKIPTPVWHEHDGGPYHRHGVPCGDEGPGLRLGELRHLPGAVAQAGCRAR